MPRRLSVTCVESELNARRSDGQACAGSRVRGRVAYAAGLFMYVRAAPRR